MNAKFDVNPYLKHARAKYTEYTSNTDETITKSIIATLITILLLFASIFILPIFIILLVIAGIFIIYKIIFTEFNIKEKN